MRKFLLFLVCVFCLSAASAGTMSISTSDWGSLFSASGSNYVATKDGYTISLIKNTSTTALVAPSSTDLRVYIGAQLKIEAPTGQKMTGIKFTVASGGKATSNSDITLSTGWSVSGTVSTTANSTFSAVSSAGDDTFVLTATKQLRLKAIEVTYTEDGGSTDPEDYTAAFDGEEYKLNVGDAMQLFEVGSKHPTFTYAYNTGGIISIDANGKITALAPGDEYVTCTWEASNGFSASTKDVIFEVKVTEPVIEPNVPMTAKFVASENYSTNAADLTEGKVGKITFSWAKGSSSNSPKYYTSDTTARVYNGNTLTVSAPDGFEITKIVFEYSQNKTLSATVDKGSFTSPTWTDQDKGGINAVVFSCSSTSYIKNITVTYHKKGPKAYVAPFDNGTYEMTVGQTTALNFGEKHPDTFTYTFDPADQELITIDAEGNIKAVKGGNTVMVTCSWDADTNFTAGSADFMVTVKKKVYNPDFKETYKVGKDHTEQLTLGEDHPEITFVYDEEVITIDADGTITPIKEGETTVMCEWGDDYFEKGNREFTVIVTDKKVYEPSFAEGEYTWLLNEPVELPLGTHPVLTFVCEPDDVISINAETGAIEILKAGDVFVTCTWEETEEYKGGEADFTVTVNKLTYDPHFENLTLKPGDTVTLDLGENHPEDVLFVSSDDKIATVDAETRLLTAKKAGVATVTCIWPGDDTYNSSSDNLTFKVTVANETLVATLVAKDEYASLISGSETNAVLDKKTTEKGQITFKWDGANGTTKVAYYKAETSVRFYKDNKLTISAPETYDITEIAFETTGGSYTLNVKADVGTVNSEKWVNKDADGNEINVNSVTFTANAQSRITKITVHYAVKTGVKIPATLKWVDANDATTEVDEFHCEPSTTDEKLPLLVVDPVKAASVVTLTSSNPDVAIIGEDKQIVINKQADGEAVITATISEDDEHYTAATASYKLVVHRKENVDLIWRDADNNAVTGEYHFKLGDENAFVPTLTVAEGEDVKALEAVVLESSVPGIVEIDGLTVTPKALGKTVITASFDENNDFFKGNPVSYTLVVDGKLQVKLQWIDAQGNQVTEFAYNFKNQSELPTLKIGNPDAEGVVIVESDNKAVASVDENNIVTVNKVGTAVITAFIDADNEHYKATPVSYTLTVTDCELPTTITISSFNYDKTAYEAKTYEEKGITYSAVLSNQSGNIALNAGNDNGKAAALVVSENNNNMIIESIDIEFGATVNSGVNVYAMNKCFEAPKKAAGAYNVDENAIKVESSLTTSKNVKIGKTAFAIQGLGAKQVQIKSIKVNYFMHKYHEMTPHPDNVKYNETTGCITVQHDLDGVTLHYKYTPAQTSKIHVLALDHGDFTEADKEDDTHTMNGITGPGTVEYYGYHEGSDIQGPTNALRINDNGTTTGIENVIDCAWTDDVEYYNLQGVKVKNPAPGNLYIKRQGNQVTKVIM